MHEAVLEISVFLKKHLTTVHEAIVSCTKQALFFYSIIL
jgi:hypothetical protein